MDEEPGPASGIARADGTTRHACGMTPLQPGESSSARSAGGGAGARARPEVWGPAPPNQLARKQLAGIRAIADQLAGEVDIIDRSATYGPLVGAADLARSPVHRWFSYKESFSPALPSQLLDDLQANDNILIADPFGGVGTTALSLQRDSRVTEIRSVEYSPLAQLVGATKLRWREVEEARLLHHLDTVLRSRLHICGTDAPRLAAFRDPRMFAPGVVASLERVRRAIERLDDASKLERDVLRVALAAIVEDSSLAMKDGRALRIIGERRRARTALTPQELPHQQLGDPVKTLLREQVLAMLEDVRLGAAGAQPFARACHVRGDARRLHPCCGPEGQRLFRADSIDITIFSPPYLNFIDYTEVYKLELWLLRFITTAAEFRRLRLGTLRSHPSLRFGDRPAPRPSQAPVFDFVHRIAGWVSEHAARPDTGRIVRQYFDDMYTVMREQARVLRPGGAAVCVVANSTLSRREKQEGGQPKELWRMPIVTDVVIAHLARQAGFGEVELWRARDLRPRNVRGGAARESLVVARM